MIFESLWPLAALLAVPVVIILYLLKPKGKDYRFSSNLLWEKLFRNMQSKTFLEKFIHNILMYLQILILLLLVLSLMSPYLQARGKSGGRVILVFDTGASMQHDAGNGRTRLEEAVKQAESLIASSEGTAFSIVSGDCMGTELLAVGIKDKLNLYEALDKLVCCDGPGDLKGAESAVETLRGDGSETMAEVILFTDGGGAQEAEGFADYFGAQVMAIGEAVDNVANNFLSYVEADTQERNAIPEDQGNIDREVSGSQRIVCASSLTNYSTRKASLEIGLYEGKRLQELKEITLEPGETTLCFFEEFVWQEEALRSEISSVSFEGTDRGDSLSADNEAYAIPSRTSRINAVLFGEGNTYIEKAYQAATGTNLTKAESGSALSQDEQAVAVYDAGYGNDAQEGGLFFGGDGNAAGKAESVLLTVTECDLTAGLSAFSIGVNETQVYQVPEWATGFLWAGEQCAGYYGEHDGVKTVMVGFDIRESDFPLKAEFPVFISNALHFLGDASLLAENVYTAGERVLFHPQADFDVNTLSADTRKAGLYQVQAGEITESYVVRFAAKSESDGQIAAQGGVSPISEGNGLVKRQLRNILLTLVLLLLVAEWILYVRQTRYRGKFYLGVRLVCAALLLLSLFGLAVNKKNGTNTTVFLVDLSDSNAQNLALMEEELRDILREMPKKNEYGIVTFGKNSLVDQFLTKNNHFTNIMSLPDRAATNFEDAMSRALAMIPSEAAGRIVILTDGRETKGEIANTAAALASRQIELLARVYEVSQGPDAYVENVELPSYLYQGDAYTMTVTVESNYETEAQIQLWRGTVQTAAYDVHLNRGANRFQFGQTVTGENMESFEVRVAASGDTCPENNSYHAYSVVDAAPKVLLVTGMREDSSQFENLLRSAGCNYQTVSAMNAPSTLDKMLEFKSILLENVYLSDLPYGFLEQIETYVKDYGCGLVCCGGEDSFALGGYRDSVLETVLPVDMELRGVNELPQTAMIMVIDHSGSMGANTGTDATSLDLAVTAAKAAVDQMRDEDYVGVLTFDDRFSWVVEPTPASDKKAIKEKIETVAEGGGTTIQPALWEALRGVSDCDASIRHVILLTDGQGETTNYDEIINQYTSYGVTLSTVAVGEGSDARLLERLAENCGGRYYYSDMASDIPKIFAQEVFLSGDTYLQNGDFGLAVNVSHEITKGLFTAGWPRIYGYVSATPKGASHVLIASEKDDPVLTVMQYGLGHTAAWNTDVTNEWTAGYAGEEDYAHLWKRIIDYTVGNASIGEDSVDVTTAGGYTNIVYRALDYGEQTKVEAVYTDPEGNTVTVPLPAAAPGLYEARLDTDITGLYNLSVRRVDEGAITNSVTTAAAVQYSDEYKFGISSAPFLSFVERCGKMLDDSEDFWKPRKSSVRERYELTKWLILAALLWFVMDIAMRRFHFLPQDTKLYHKLKSRRKEQGAPSVEKTVSPPADNLTRAEGPANRSSDSISTDWEASAPQSSEKDDKKGRGTKAKKNEGQGKKRESQALDTSALLKRKDQRKQ